MHTRIVNRDAEMKMELLTEMQDGTGRNWNLKWNGIWNIRSYKSELRSDGTAPVLIQTLSVHLVLGGLSSIKE